MGIFFGIADLPSLVLHLGNEAPYFSAGKCGRSKQPDDDESNNYPNTARSRARRK
jgi:hypothetical protein